eukprot:252976-Chlamydomonas_euryale.AAC.1
MHRSVGRLCQPPYPVPAPGGSRINCMTNSRMLSMLCMRRDARRGVSAAAALSMLCARRDARRDASTAAKALVCVRSDLPLMACSAHRCDLPLAPCPLPFALCPGFPGHACTNLKSSAPRTHAMHPPSPLAHTCHAPSQPPRLLSASADWEAYW